MRGPGCCEVSSCVLRLLPRLLRFGVANVKSCLARLATRRVHLPCRPRRPQLGLPAAEPLEPGESFVWLYYVPQARMLPAQKHQRLNLSRAVSLVHVHTCCCGLSLSLRRRATPSAKTTSCARCGHPSRMRQAVAAFCSRSLRTGTTTANCLQSTMTALWATDGACWPLAMASWVTSKTKRSRRTRTSSRSRPLRHRPAPHLPLPPRPALRRRLRRRPAPSRPALSRPPLAAPALPARCHPRPRQSRRASASSTRSTTLTRLSEGGEDGKRGDASGGPLLLPTVCEVTLRLPVLSLLAESHADSSRSPRALPQGLPCRVRARRRLLRVQGRRAGRFQRRVWPG
jgi:hypothetical protein